MRYLISSLALVTALHGAVIIDRLAVIVGKNAIKISDVDRDVRLTQFLNKEAMHLDAKARHESAERLVDQEIIRREISSGGYRRPVDREAEALESQLKRDRFGGSVARFHQTLEQYGLTEEQLRNQLLWQLTVLAFIDERFRAGVLVTDEDIRAYYEQHAAALRAENPKDPSREVLRPKIKTLLEGERINEAFNQWLEQARKSYRVEYRQEAFE
jgi:peptidyl-prolyl cis-trans isomerase SurA